MKFTKKNKKKYKMSNIPPVAFRFYDNQKDIIKQFHTSLKYVESILVSNNSNEEIMNKNNSKLYTSIFLNNNPNNKFAMFLNNINNKEQATSIGFSQKDAMDLQIWSESPIPQKIVIFDWDRTLSIIEGIFLPNSITDTNYFKNIGISYRDIAIYYVGSEFRCKWLRYIFEYLNNKNVEVFILTNNPIAAVNWNILKLLNIGINSRYNFYRVAKEIIPQLMQVLLTPRHYGVAS
jgi:hypothetical protein